MGKCYNGRCCFQVVDNKNGIACFSVLTCKGFSPKTKEAAEKEVEKK